MMYTLLYFMLPITNSNKFVIYATMNFIGGMWLITLYQTRESKEYADIIMVAASIHFAMFTYILYVAQTHGLGSP